MKLFLLSCLLVLCCEGNELNRPRSARPGTNERVIEREAMVIQQIERRGVKNPLVLTAMRIVPRHRFIPKSHHDLAYGDHPVPIGHGQTISQPYIVAYMTEALKPKRTDRVLEIGTGSGYQAAVLAEIVQAVHTIEIVPELAKQSKLLLDEMNYENIQLRTGDGYQGWPEAAPFDKIIVTAAPPKIPKPLLNQLKVGGLMTIPVGEKEQGLILIKRTMEGYEKQKVMGVRFVPMTGKAQKNR